MRIRSIKPEFWRSDDITGLAWDDRLIFIGLWSYVDDNGVGMDKLASIAADLFAGDIERDSSETFARVSRGLQNLSEQGRITRYIADGKRFLHITNWERHQRIDKPNKPRYPLPTCDDAEIREIVAEPSRDSRETPAPGTGEQGNRGTGEVKTSSPAKPSKDFEEFWKSYPRKVGKGAAIKAHAKALKTASSEQIQSGVESLRISVAGKDPKFTPHPSTWLNEMRWEDEAPEQVQGSVVPAQYGWANR